MNQVQHSIKMDRLIEIAKDNPRDISFIMQYLSKEDLETFNQLINEKRLKVRRKKNHHKREAFKSSLITVLGEPRLAAELAVAISKLNRDREVAILDADRFDPKLDVYLNSKCYIKSVFTHLDVNRTTGLNLLVDAIHKKTLTPQYAKHLALRIHGIKNLYYFSGSYILDDYEYYKIEDFKKVLSFLKSNYDTVIISSNHFIYDGFTCHALMTSDVNLISVSGHLTDIKEKVKLMHFLERKQQVKSSKNIYVMFDYNKKLHVDKRVFQTLTSKQSHIIPYSQYRSYGISRNYHLTKHMKRGQINVYNKLLHKIHKVTI